MRVAPHHVGLQTDELQQLSHSRGAIGARHFWEMNFQRLTDNLADGEAGVQRPERILKNHLHLATQGAELAFRKREDFAAIEFHEAGGRWDQLQDRAADRGLAAPAFADEADGFSGFDGERDIVHRADVPDLAAHHAAQHGKPSAKILNLQQRHGGTWHGGCGVSPAIPAARFRAGGGLLDEAGGGERLVGSVF